MEHDGPKPADDADTCRSYRLCNFRRWMQRENERVARKYKQQERDRIAKLVSRLHPESSRKNSIRSQQLAAERTDIINHNQTYYIFINCRTAGN